MSTKTKAQTEAGTEEVVTLTKAQIEETLQQEITVSALKRATENFMAGEAPRDTSEADAQAQAQADYDAQDKPKVSVKKYEHEGVMVSYPSNLSRSQAFLYLTHITNKIMSGSD